MLSNSFAATTRRRAVLVQNQSEWGNRKYDNVLGLINKRMVNMTKNDIYPL